MISRASSAARAGMGSRSAGTGSTGLESSPVTAVPSAEPGSALISDPHSVFGSSPRPLRSLLAGARCDAHSPVDSPHDGVDRGDRGDDVGDHAALAHRGRRLQVHEAWVPHVDAPRPGAAVTDYVVAELAAR